MSKEPIILNGRLFSTKKEITIFFRDMLYRYEIGQSLEGNDQQFLFDLLDGHRYAAELKSKPIAAFRVQASEMHKGRRFEIVREDDSVNEFSYLKCISPPRNPHFQDMMWALRCAVLEQTHKFHNNSYRGNSVVACGITGAPVKPKDAHIDHVPPLTFQALVASFLNENGLSLDGVQISSQRSVGYPVKHLADEMLEAKWREYHLLHAVLRVTSKTANLKAKKHKCFNNTENIS